MKRVLPVILLAWASLAAAQEGMPRADWLANLRSGVGQFLCAPQSPLMRVYKEPISSCPVTVTGLFDKCTTSVAEVEIPNFITSADQANKKGQLIAECISAHYMGGAALDAFKTLNAPAKK